MKKRCTWCEKDTLYIKYHDEKWGRPLHDDRLLFELLTLEGAQAGLSWITILKKRENYRKAFENFDYVKIANYTNKDIEKLLKNSGIVRHRKKIESVVKNAIEFLKIQKEFGSFDKFIWNFVGGTTIQNQFSNQTDIPSKTNISEKMSKDLKKRGFNFVGPTICYAFMQATGMVNDHTTDCYLYQEIKALR